jgi:uncharacterized protein YkwD
MRTIGKRLVAGGLAAALATAFIGGPRPAWTAPRSRATDNAAAAEPQSEATAQMEFEALERINRIRRDNGLEPLKSHPVLTRLARDFSRQMARGKFFDHESPDGKTLVDRIREAKLEYALIGENIFKSVNVQGPAERAVLAWMNSSGHKKNILTADFTTTGLGVWQDGKTCYFTQEFMRPR